MGNIMAVCCLVIIVVLAATGLSLYPDYAEIPTSVTYFDNTPQCIEMTTSYSPFRIELDEHAKNSTLKTGIKCFIATDEISMIQAFWNVCPFDIMDFMKTNYSTDDNILLNLLRQDEILKSAQCKGEIYDVVPSATHHFFEPPHDIDVQSLGSDSRVRIPLVVLIFRSTGIPYSPTFVRMVALIHVKDDLLPLNSYIIQTMMKLSTGRVIIPKTMYIPIEQDERAICVICMDFYAYYVLLPCRHKCVCQYCFKQQTTCPVCRSYVQFYFKNI